MGWNRAHFADPLLMLSSIESGPGDSPRVLALQEEGFGFPVLETEDFAVAADVDFPLFRRN